MRRIFRHWFTRTVMIAFMFGSVAAFRFAQVQAAACNDQGFGIVSGLSVNIASSDTGTYRVWSRLQVPTANSTYMLEVNGTCYTVGGSGLATGQWTWVGNQSGGSPLTINLTAGTHNIRLIGTAENVLLDRVIFTKSTSAECNPPQGNGDSCVNKVEDTTPPTVSILTPVNGSSINNGSTTLTASASDIGGSVTKVAYFLTGVPNAPVKIGESTTAPYSVAWNTAGLANGSYNIIARAYDNATPANEGVTAVARAVTVANGQPNLKITSLSVTPASPKVNDNVTVTAVVKNDGTVATASNFTVGFKVGTASLAGVSTAGTLGVNATTTVTTTWKPTAGGSYTISAEADTAPGVIAESNENDNSTNIGVAVSSPDTTAPTVSFVAPLANASNLNGDVTITASASDNTGGSGMQRVVFFVDDSQVGQATSGTDLRHSYTWNSKSVANGGHKLSVVAYDKAGNATSKVNINISVNNSLPPIAVPGDLNGDGVVNYQFDLLPVLNNYGKSGISQANGNADGDPAGLVNYIDLMLVVNGWTI